MWCVSGATPAAVAAAASRSAPLRGPAPLPALVLMGTTAATTTTTTTTTATASARHRRRGPQHQHQAAASASSAAAGRVSAAAPALGQAPAAALLPAPPASAGLAPPAPAAPAAPSATAQQSQQLLQQLLQRQPDDAPPEPPCVRLHRQLPAHRRRPSSATACNAPFQLSFSSASPCAASPLAPRRRTCPPHHPSRLRGHLDQLHLSRCHLLRRDAAALVATARCVLLDLAPVRRRPRSPPVSIMGSASQQTRAHGGHHHHHHHDNSYLISANKNDSGVRITRIGLLSNLGIAVAKFVGGWAFNSKAMTADAWHSIADLASDVLTLATISWSLKPPSDRFPLGFGKVESLGSLGVSGMLLFGGFYMGWESAISLFGHFNPEAARELLEHVGHGHGHGHSHSHSAASLGIPSIHAAWLAAGTILVKEWLYHATMKVARERRSSVLASNAVHHRVDSLTGIVTLAAILGANVLENAAWLDPVGGLLISIMVVNAGLQNTKSALCELADQSIDTDVKGSVRKQAHYALANATEGHKAELRNVSGVKSGQNYLVDLEMAVPGGWTVDEMRALEDQVRTQVGGKVRGVRRVRVRFVPRDAAADERFSEFIPGSVHVEADPEPRENGAAAEDKDSTTGHGHGHGH